LPAAAADWNSWPLLDASENKKMFFTTETVEYTMTVQWDSSWLILIPFYGSVRSA